MLNVAATATEVLAPYGIAVRRIEIVGSACGPVVEATIGVPKRIGKRLGQELAVESLGRALDMIPRVRVEVDGGTEGRPRRRSATQQVA